MKYHLATFAPILAALAWTVQPAVAQDRTYAKPMYQDLRLDFCLQWGQNCGQPAADAFCQRRRFTGAKQFRAERVGPARATRLIGTGQVCANQAYCTGFDFITCFGAIGYDRVFANPAWRGHRLDVCLRWGTECGKPAADAFCRANGFAEALSFASDPTPGRRSTRLIGTDQICNAAYCVGFQQIVCK